MADKADESATEEVVENVELDQEPDIQGDVIENPVPEETEEAEEVEDDATATDEGTDDDAESGDDSDEAAETEEASAADDAEVEADEDVKTAEVVKEAEVKDPVADPGEFQPKLDYSFEVTTTDGKTVKITTPAEAEAFEKRLDEEEGLVSASQFSKFARAAAKMDLGLEQEQKAYEADKQQFEEQQAEEQTRNQQLQQWSNELTYLRNRGLIPKPSAAADADWLGNPDAEGIKEARDIFAWMDKENQSRREAGIGEVTSAVDAFHLMKAENVETAASEARTQEADTRRAKGSMVRGNAPHTPSNMPKNTIVGPGGNLNDLVYEAQMNM